MAQPEVATDLTPLEPGRNGDSFEATEPLPATLARSTVWLEQARFDLDLSNRVQERLLKEIERLEQRLADAEAERLELLEQVNHRDRLLTQIFRSRSWRWTQALRRSLGRR
ncbi:MAG TPA: hypothetical protein VFD92_26095 [Candidatus Binatia bacterium]|nr:hypothetical protein [Candidatus Binatia bacterium]